MEGSAARSTRVAFQISFRALKSQIRTKIRQQTQYHVSAKSGKLNIFDHSDDLTSCNRASAHTVARRGWFGFSGVSFTQVLLWFRCGDDARYAFVGCHWSRGDLGLSRRNHKEPRGNLTVYRDYFIHRLRNFSSSSSNEFEVMA